MVSSKHFLNNAVLKSWPRAAVLPDALKLTKPERIKELADYQFRTWRKALYTCRQIPMNVLVQTDRRYF